MGIINPKSVKKGILRNLNPNLLKKEYDDKVAKMKARAIEVDDCSENEIINWAWIYTELAPEDDDGLISIRRVKNFFENQVQKEMPETYKKIIWFFDVSREEMAYKKEVKVLQTLQSHLKSLRTISNAYKYSVAVSYAIDKMAMKLDAPEDMDNVTRAKWLRIWLNIFRDMSFCWTDFDPKTSKILRYDEARIFENAEIVPEMMVLFEQYFRKFDDGEIIYEMIESLLKLYPEDTQKKIRAFGELDENKVETLQMRLVRTEIKSKVFPCAWREIPGFFCTKEGIKKFDISKMQFAIQAEKDGGIESLPIIKTTTINAYKNFKIEKCNLYELGVVDEKMVYVATKEELKMYSIVYQWLEKHPDFQFGKECKTLEEYGLLGLLDEKATFEDMTAIWILDMNLALDEDDINWIIADKIFEGKENLIEKYFIGDINAEDILDEIGFNSEAQAQACFSLRMNKAKEILKISDALKRVKMFKIPLSSKSDLIYLELFKYLLEYDKEKLPKNVIRQYGTVNFN